MMQSQSAHDRARVSALQTLCRSRQARDGFQLLVRNQVDWFAEGETMDRIRHRFAIGVTPPVDATELKSPAHPNEPLVLWVLESPDAGMPKQLGVYDLASFLALPAALRGNRREDPSYLEMLGHRVVPMVLAALDLYLRHRGRHSA
ncbi:MAG TPA: hypothetical protein VKB38_15580 [Terracidiphilus sp.]|nr:hypothetical protein [Terracidiphilus sp.]